MLLKDNPLLKTRMEAIVGRPEEECDTAYRELMDTQVGEVQSEFLRSVEREIDRVAEFYQSLAKKSIRQCNQLLIDRDDWE
jgi:hypothetical protein